MKRTFTIMGLFFGMETSFSQTEMDFMVPHFNFGKGIKEMNDVNKVVGFGYDFGYNFPNNSFGVSGFYNMNNISSTTHGLPIYREEDGLANAMDIDNKSRVSTYGMKFRYSPQAFKYSKVSPYFEVGGGFATHTGVWRSDGESILVDNTDPECPKYDYMWRDRGLMYRNTTIIGVGEIGVRYRLFGGRNTSERMRMQGDDTSWYLTASARWEYGGNVNYTNARYNPNHFYYDSGINEDLNRPFMQRRSNPDRSFITNSRHNMLIFQVSFTRALF